MFDLAELSNFVIIEYCRIIATLLASLDGTDHHNIQNLLKFDLEGVPKAVAVAYESQKN